MDCVQLASKNVSDGTRLAPPTDVPISTEWRQRLKQIRQFSSPRNEIFFAESVVLVEGTTEVGAISVLSEMMSEPLDFDRLNCSVIEVNGKDNLPLFIKMAHALGKRVLAIYDTYSDKTAAHDQSTNTKKNQASVDAMDGKGDLFACDPYFEQIAGITEGSKKEKEAKVREHVASVSGWNDVPDELKCMMQAVKKVAENKVASSN
jgi:predicted ATP-dependent endonuclease of OLD family